MCCTAPSQMYGILRKIGPAAHCDVLLSQVPRSLVGSTSLSPRVAVSIASVASSRSTSSGAECHRSARVQDRRRRFRRALPHRFGWMPRAGSQRDFTATSPVSTSPVSTHEPGIHEPGIHEPGIAAKLYGTVMAGSIWGGGEKDWSFDGVAWHPPTIGSIWGPKDDDSAAKEVSQEQPWEFDGVAWHPPTIGTIWGGGEKDWDFDGVAWHPPAGIWA